MGGRGASSGRSVKGKDYGTEYSTLYQSGNIKFVRYNDGNATAPFETMTKGRVYVTVSNKGEPKFISYYDKNNKRFKQIDLSGKSHYIDRNEQSIKLETPHTHKGYEHDEKGTFKTSKKEQKMIERVQKAWDYHTGLK